MTTTTSTIPETVTRAQLQEALTPLLDLLGTDWLHIYATPGIHIRQNGDDLEVTFAHVPAAAEDSESGRPVGIPAEPSVQGKLGAELAEIVTVQVRP